MNISVPGVNCYIVNWQIKRTRGRQTTHLLFASEKVTRQSVTFQASRFKLLRDLGSGVFTGNNLLFAVPNHLVSIIEDYQTGFSTIEFFHNSCLIK